MFRGSASLYTQGPLKTRPRSGGGYAPARSKCTLLFQRIMSLSIEDTRTASSSYIRDEEGKMLRDPGLILGRWARFFAALFNAKFDKLRLDIIEGPPQWPVTHDLGVEPTENAVTVALRLMANAKAVVVVVVVIPYAVCVGTYLSIHC